jgi:hypothetical protein
MNPNRPRWQAGLVRSGGATYQGQRRLGSLLTADEPIYKAQRRHGLRRSFSTLGRPAIAAIAFAAPANCGRHYALRALPPEPKTGSLRSDLSKRSLGLNGPEQRDHIDDITPSSG